MAIGSFVVTWYGVLYIVAFWLAWMILPRLQDYRSLKIRQDDWVSILAAGVAGVLIGGRLGYVLFYEPGYFINHPLEVLAIWNGGMSSHGGFLGVALALWVMVKHLKISYWDLMDVAVVPVALGLALGRVANFINQELYVSTIGFGVAVAKNLLIFVVTYWLLIKGKKRSGMVLAIFLIMYSVLRFLTEFLRVQDYADIWELTRGQLYSLPLLLLGLWVLRHAEKSETELVE